MSSWPRPGRSAVAEPGSWTLVRHGNAGNISHRLDRALLLEARLRSCAPAPAPPTSAAEALRQVTGEGRRARQLDRASEPDDALQRLVDVAHLAVGAHERTQVAWRRWESTIQYLDLSSGRTTPLYRNEGSFLHLSLTVSPMRNGFFSAGSRAGSPS